EEHARRVADLACDLFDQLKAEHGLGPSERRLLRVAGLLHDIGVFISNRSHHKHSEYIIQASDIFGLRANDKNLAATIARYHRRSGPKPTHPGFTSLTRQERATVSKLAAILRVADALDRSHSGKIRSPRIELRPNEAILRLDTSEDLTLERLAMRSKGEMFEEVYGRKIILENVRL
ncbi:MAG: HD domain-containing protein, partial [Candidatus Sumerlaeota bacterium]|nr:HD domain-containing protein [Candidatus Sumerlaeota bacterium]